MSVAPDGHFHHHCHSEEARLLSDLISCFKHFVNDGESSLFGNVFSSCLVYMFLPLGRTLCAQTENCIVHQPSYVERLIIYFCGLAPWVLLIGFVSKSVGSSILELEAWIVLLKVVL